MSPLLLGELAGLLTASLWSVSSMLFTLAGRTIGSLMVNRWRLVIAFLLLVAVHTLLYAHPFPVRYTMDVWGWLAISGVVGLVLGDTLLFRTFVILGPRSGMVLMTLAPVFSTVMAWLFLGEVLTLRQLSGIAITTAGVAWAIAHHPRMVEPSHEGSHLVGVLAGIGAASMQAGGLILARKGLESGIPAFSANVIRIGAAMTAIWIVTLMLGRLPAALRALRSRTAMIRLGLGSAIGPTLGVWMSLVAIKHAPVGIASSLMSTTPILMIPLSRVFLKEPVRFQSVAGTIVAVFGVVLLLTHAG